MVTELGPQKSKSFARKGGEYLAKVALPIVLGAGIGAYAAGSLAHAYEYGRFVSIPGWDFEQGFAEITGGLFGTAMGWGVSRNLRGI